MKDALGKDSRLHRDLSIGNVILVQHPDRPIRTGYLIDWELSCEVDENGRARLPGHVVSLLCLHPKASLLTPSQGTWAFTSIGMLDVHEQKTGKHTFEDDMESLLYVVLYAALLWQPHDFTRAELSRIIKNMFEDAAPLHGGMHGGGGKSANAMMRAYTRDMHLSSAPLQEWLTTVMDFHKPLTRSEVINKWTAEDLDAYWTTFLETHTLEDDNRVVHHLASPSYRSYTPSNYSSSEPIGVPDFEMELMEGNLEPTLSSSAPLPTSGPQLKQAGRGLKESTPDGPIARRLRSREKVAHNRASLALPARRDLRRNKRVQTQKRGKAQQSVRKKSTAVPAAQSTTRGRKRVKSSTRK